MIWVETDYEVKIRMIYPGKRLLEAGVRRCMGLTVEELGNARMPLAEIDTTKQR